LKRIRPHDRSSLQVTALKPPRRKSAVYRLIGAGPGGANIIAKRAQRATVETERRVYQEVLSILPVSSLCLHAVVNDEDERYAWLYLEDAGDFGWSPELAEHRQLAANWLAEVHLGAASLVGKVALPYLGTAYYLDLVRAARDSVISPLANDSLSDSGRELLRRLDEDCLVLQTHWSAFASLLSQIPWTLSVPGLGAKNTRVRSTDSRLELLAFDFENAFIGPAVIELQGIDTDAYSQTVGRSWAVGKDGIELLASLGRAFGAIKSIPGELSTLMSAWPERSIRKLGYYAGHVAEALQVLGLAQHGSIRHGS
jgi:hypothetical protein